MQLVVSLLSQGGSHKHAQLLLPAVHYCLLVWDRASAPHAAASTDADVQHVRAAALAALLSLLRYRWKVVLGSSAAAATAPVGSIAQQAAATAAAAGAHGAQAGGEGTAIVARVLHLLLEFFGVAASLAAVLPAADVRLVLEELFELQVGCQARCAHAACHPAAGPPAARRLPLLTARSGF